MLQKVNKIKKYFRTWCLLTVRASQVAFVSRFGALIFILGKLLRFVFFLLFILILVSRTNLIVGYSFWQVIFFYVTFNLIDSLPQFFLREVYRFRYYVVSGSFDYILTKPFSSLFRSLFGGCDVLDLSILIPSTLLIFFIGSKIEQISPMGIVFYILLIFNAFLIALAFHIFVLAVGVLTTEVDNTIMLYRDLTQMGRFPIDIYKEPLRGILTFVIPIGIMITFPAKALMGLLSIQGIIISFFIGGLMFFISIKFWRFSLKRYSSASS